MAGQGVGPGQIQRLFADHDVLDAVVARHAGEHLVFILLHRGGDRKVDLVGQAGDLQESAALAGGIHGAQLQRVQDLLAGGLYHAHLVAEGMNGDDLAVGDIARGDIHTDAAAVDKGDLGAGHGPVGVRAQVAQVGLLAANQPDGGVGGIIDAQRDLGGGDDGIHHLLVPGLDGIQRFAHAAVIDESGGDGAVGGDGQAADVGQLGAGGGQQDLLALFILYHIAGDDRMGMAVQHGVDAAGIHDDLGRGPGAAVGLNAQMRHRDDIFGAFAPGGVHGALHGGVQLFAGLILHKAVDVFAGIVLEIGGGGGGNGLGGGNAHKGDLGAVDLLDHIGLQHGVAVGVHKVGADIIEVGGFGQGQELLHAVVELMVAGGGNVVAQLVHDLDDVRALGKGADGVALNGVAVIHQQDAAARGGQAVLHGRQTGIAQAVLDAAVGVVGVQDDDITGAAAAGGCAAPGQYHHQYQEPCEDSEFFHSGFPPFVFFFSVCLVLLRQGFRRSPSITLYGKAGNRQTTVVYNLSFLPSRAQTGAGRASRKKRPPAGKKRRAAERGQASAFAGGNQQYSGDHHNDGHGNNGNGDDAVIAGDGGGSQRRTKQIHGMTSKHFGIYEIIISLADGPVNRFGNN